MSPIRIGTSGWTYRDWRGRFYPARLPQSDWLAWYAARFPTVELNVTTYRLPRPADCLRWTCVPPDFDDTVKLSRLITHRRTPGEPVRFVENFFAAIAPLGGRVANVVEFRHPSFGVYAYFNNDQRAFAARNVALLRTLVDGAGSEPAEDALQQSG